MPGESRYSLDELESHDYGIMTELDPRLQRMVVHSMEETDVSFDLAPPETAVIALVTDASAWFNHSAVRGIMAAPQLADGTSIVTGRVRIEQIQDLRREPFVLSMKAAHPVRHQLRATLPDLGVDSLPSGSSANGGKGVVIGIIDNGCDFAHPNFRNPDGNTRLLGIWDQSQLSRPVDSGRVKFGRFFTPDEINAALKHTDPYTALGYSPEQSAHGTHVMDIAAGNGRGTGQAGVAPQADILFVELSTDDLPPVGASKVNHGLGDSVHLVEALSFIFDSAGTRPCVVNVSLGSNSGSHDGTSLVERALDTFAAAHPNRSVVVAAGNAFSDGIHVFGHLTPGGVAELDWKLDDPLTDDAELEIWYSGADSFTIDVVSPTNKVIATVAAGKTRTLVAKGQTTIMISSRQGDPNNHDNQISVFLAQGLKGGTWKIRITGIAATHGDFHAWIERDDADQSSFDNAPADNSHTISSLAAGSATIVVGAYDAHLPARPLYFGSAAGPTRDGRAKPDVSAPGVNVAAANARMAGATMKTGTSMASPSVAGTVALLLAEAHARGVSLSSTDIRDLIVSNTRSNAGLDPRYGGGRVSAESVIQRFLTMPAPMSAHVAGK